MRGCPSGAKTKCNHPEELLNLCSNHHTNDDDGGYGPDKKNAEFVKSSKMVLHYHQRRPWVMQDEVGRKLFLVVADCERLAWDEEGEVAGSKKTSRESPKRLAELPTLTPVSHADPPTRRIRPLRPGSRL